MASLIENLINTLEAENSEYEELLELSMKKTGIIVKGDVNELGEIVEKEQLVVEKINSLEKKRTEVTNDIALVLNRKTDELKLPVLAELLSGQKKESEALRNIHDKLQETLSNMVRVNENNKALLQESIDMVDFEINLAQSMRQAPATANYSGGTYTDDTFGPSGSFDAKQ